MTLAPLDQFFADRSRARQADDPTAAVCTVANVDTQQRVQLRTLVLREIDGHLALFINASSPKWPHLLNGVALQTYWPSLQIQYRMQANAQELDPELVADSWQARPPAPKRLDHYYAQHRAQSTPVTDRHTLLSELAQLSLPEPLQAPDNARGLLLQPYEIERLDLTQDNGVHERLHYQLMGNQWHMNTLVP